MTPEYRDDPLDAPWDGFRFRDRSDAGAQLAQALTGYADRQDVLVLALPRGGVPLGVEVARELDAPLDLLLVRKLGVPGHEELAMGAVASGGVRVLNEDVVGPLGLSEEVVEAVADRERTELERRARAYRGDRPTPELEGRTIVLVDDGLATGATMRAAVEAVRKLEPARIVVAVPVAPPDTCERLEEVADEVVCVERPDPFLAIGVWYERFPQITDERVRDLLDEVAVSDAKDR